MSKKIPMTKIKCPKIHMLPKKSMSHNKIDQCPTKFYHNQNFWHVHTQLPNFSITMPLKKKFPHDHVHVQSRKFPHIQKHNHKFFFFMIQHHIPNKNISVARIPYPQNYSILIPLKVFCHVHKTKITHAIKSSTFIMILFNQAYTTNFSRLQCPQNSSQNSSNNITNYQHCQNSISHQHCPDYTMTKRYNTSKMLQSQHYNMINHTMPQIPTRSHNNTMTMSQHQIFNSKSQILNSTSKFSHPKFPIPNSQTPSFQIQISKLQNFKISNPKFQVSKFQVAPISNLNFQVSKFSSHKLSKSQVLVFQNFKFQIFQDLKFQKFKIQFQAFSFQIFKLQIPNSKLFWIKYNFLSNNFIHHKTHRFNNSSPIPFRIKNISPTFKGSTVVLLYIIGSTIALLPSRDWL